MAQPIDFCFAVWQNGFPFSAQFPLVAIAFELGYFKLVHLQHFFSVLSEILEFIIHFDFLFGHVRFLDAHRLT